MLYYYRTAQGLATLSKNDTAPVKFIGKFKTEADALAACKAHYAKAEQSAKNIGVSIPPAVFA